MESGWMEDNQENMTQWIKFSGLTWENRDRNCNYNHRTCTTSSAHISCCLALCFCQTPNSRSRCVSDSSTYSCDSFTSVELPCPDLIWGLLPCLLLCFVLFSCCFLKACCFKKRKLEIVDFIEGGEIVFRISCMRENLFLIKKMKASQNAWTLYIENSTISMFITYYLFYFWDFKFLNFLFFLTYLPLPSDTLSTYYLLCL